MAELFFSVYVPQRLWWSTSRQLLQPRCSRDYGGDGAPFEDHVPRQAGCKTRSRIFGASLIVMTRMSRHSVVAPILAAPLLTDTRRLTVGPGTREDLVVATVPVVAYFVPVCSIYVASAFGVSGPVHYCVSACHGHCACGVWSRLAAEVLVSGSVHTHVARMTYLGSGFQHSGRLATSGRNASRCGKEAKRRTQLGTQPRLSSAPAVRLRRGVESLGPQAHIEEVLR